MGYNMHIVWDNDSNFIFNSYFVSNLVGDLNQMGAWL